MTINLDDITRITFRYTFPACVRRIFQSLDLPLPSPTWPDELNDDELGVLADKLGDALAAVERGDD